MSYKYDPKEARQCLPEGVYEATVISAEVKERPEKGDMIVIELEVYAGSKTARLKDYITVPAFLWKLKKLAKAIGRLDRFESGDFNEKDYAGMSVKVELRVQESEEYGESNRIWAYHPPATGQVARAPAKASGVNRHSMPDGHTTLEPDDIPF